MDNKEDYIKRRILEEQLDDKKKKLKKLERLEELSNKEQYRSHRLKEQLYHIFGREYNKHMDNISYCEELSRKNLTKRKNTLLDEEADLKIKYSKLKKWLWDSRRMYEYKYDIRLCSKPNQ